MTSSCGRGGGIADRAANFRSGRVEVYDSNFKPVELPGSLFVDPRIPAGYAPFDVQELAGKLYVTYAEQDAALHDVAGPGHGFVDIFTNDGAFVKRLVTRSQLNSSWGLALAPAGSGRFGGDLLAGNFGNGRINVYNPDTGARLGELRQANGQPIVIDGLWGLLFGNGTPPRQANCSSPPDPMVNRTDCWGRSSRPAKQLPATGNPTAAP